jgi:hypothetical protein
MSQLQNFGCVIRNMTLLIWLLLRCVGDMEIEELLLLLGCCLGQHENVVVEGAGDAAFLENTGAVEAVGWVRCCTVFPGDAGGCSGANRMETEEHKRCVA